MRRRLKLRSLHASRIARQPSLDIYTLEHPKVQLSFVGIKNPVDRHKPIFQYFQSLFEQYNLKGWKMGYDSASRRAGACHGSKKLITLSKHFVLHNTAEEIKNTIVHEIAHAIDNEDRGYSNHDGRWKAIAIALGDDGARCYDSEKVVMPEGKHLYACISCSKEVRYHKRKSNKFSCIDCARKNGVYKFDERFLFVYKGVKPVAIISKVEEVEEIEEIEIPTQSLAANTTSTKPQGTTIKKKEGTKSDQMKALFDSGVTSISEIAKQVGAHYSHVHTVITKYKNSK